MRAQPPEATEWSYQSQAAPRPRTERDGATARRAAGGLVRKPRLFYVGLTRARDEAVDTRGGRMYRGRSPFLNEFEARMQEAEGD